MNKSKIVFVILIFLIILSNFSHLINADNFNSTSNPPNSSPDSSLKFFFKWLFGNEAQSQSYKLLSFWKSTYVLTENQFFEGYNIQLGYKERIKFKVNKEYYYLGIVDIKSNAVKIILDSNNQTLQLGDSRKTDLNSDGYFDVFLTLNSIKGFFKKADITLFYINEKTNQESLLFEEEKELNASNQFGVTKNRFDFKEVNWLIWLATLLIFLILLALIIVYFSMKKNH